MARGVDLLLARPLAVSGGVAGAVVVAGLARRQPLSWDEAVTTAVATRPPAALLDTVHHSDAVLGLYYLLMHGWQSWLTTLGVRMTETWWRLPSALAVVATAVLVAVLARRAAGDRAAVAAGTLFAVLPLVSFYAVDARPYALASLVVTSAWALWQRERTWLRAMVVVVLLVAAAWLQLFTVLVWPAFVIVAVGRRRRALVVLAVAAAGVVPLLLLALGQSAEIGWIPAASVTNTARVGLHVVGGIGVLVGAVALAVVGFRRDRSRFTATKAAFAWWIVAPFLLLAALDVVRPVLVARYALVSLPLAAVAVGVLVARRASLWMRVAAVATVVVALVTTAVQVTRPWKYEDYRAAAAYARTESAPGGAVLFAPSSTRLGFEPYARGSWWRDLALPGGVGDDPLAITELPGPEVRTLAAQVCSLLVVGAPVGVTGRPVVGAAAPAAVAGWRVVAARSFGSVTVSVVSSPRCNVRPVGSAYARP